MNEEEAGQLPSLLKAFRLVGTVFICHFLLQ